MDQAIVHADKNIHTILTNGGLPNPPDHLATYVWAHPWAALLVLAMIFAVGAAISWGIETAWARLRGKSIPGLTTALPFVQPSPHIQQTHFGTGHNISAETVNLEKPPFQLTNEVLEAAFQTIDPTKPVTVAWTSQGALMGNKLLEFLQNRGAQDVDFVSLVSYAYAPGHPISYLPNGLPEITPHQTIYVDPDA